MRSVLFSSGKQSWKGSDVAAFFSRNNTLGFLIASAAWLFLFLHQFGLGRRISKYIDRYNIRPSVIDGLSMATLGIASTLHLFAQPSLAFAIHLTLGVSGTFFLAFAVEMFRTPASEQIRPHWYVGDGKPEWQPPPGWHIRFSMFSVGVFVTGLCIALGIAAPRWAAHRSDQANRESTITRIQELGGEVQQQHVVLSGTAVTDDELKLLVHLKHIKWLNLNLGATNITNEGVKHIAQLPRLRILQLSGTNVDDAGLRHLRESTKLSILNLRKTNVTGTGLREEWTELKQLDLSLCPVSREGIQQAANYPHLVQLSLIQTEIDDSMIDVLAQLRVKTLEIHRTNITREGFEQLKSQATHIETIRWSENLPPPNVPFAP